MKYRCQAIYLILCRNNKGKPPTIDWTTFDVGFTMGYRLVSGAGSTEYRESTAARPAKDCILPRRSPGTIKMILQISGTPSNGLTSAFKYTVLKQLNTLIIYNYVDRYARKILFRIIFVDVLDRYI